MIGCERWVDGAPCGEPAVEHLAYLNTNINGGTLPICSAHLAEYLAEHFPHAPSA